jgi:hypothetical protein
MAQDMEVPLRRLPLPIPPLYKEERARLTPLVGSESTSSRHHNPQASQLFIPPELSPVSRSAPASPSAGSLMLSFRNTTTGHGINDVHAPMYASPPSFGQAAPLLDARLGILQSLRGPPGVNFNDPTQLFSTPLVPLTKQRARGPRPLPPKPIPHDTHQQSSTSLSRSSSATPAPASRFVAPSHVESMAHVDRVLQIRPLPDVLGPSVPLPSSRRVGNIDIELAKSASYATTSFSSTPQPPGGIRYGSPGDWGMKPEPSIGSTLQPRGTDGQSSVCPIHCVLGSC